mmetsp:Transcript_2583/g.6640  ORF Transcript_2583/g.6640 Transcript_2583/m.6640 type:complete len:204 (+) Transcript_2583:2055-2666(+)
MLRLGLAGLVPLRAERRHCDLSYSQRLLGLLGQVTSSVRPLHADLGKGQRRSRLHSPIPELLEDGQSLQRRLQRLGSPLDRGLRDGDQHGRLPASLTGRLKFGELLVRYLQRLVMFAQLGVRIDDSPQRVCDARRLLHLAEDGQAALRRLQRLLAILVAEVLLGRGQEHRSLAYLRRQARVLGHGAVLLRHGAARQGQRVARM